MEPSPVENPPVGTDMELLEDNTDASVSGDTSESGVNTGLGTSESATPSVGVAPDLSSPPPTLTPPSPVPSTPPLPAPQAQTPRRYPQRDRAAPARLYSTMDH